MSKKAEKYNTFGKRLLTVADARQMGDTGTLANAIYSNKRCREIVKIREHKEYTNPFEEVAAASFHSSRNVAVTSEQTLTPVADGGYICIKGVDFADGAQKALLKVIPGENAKNSVLKICADHFGSNGTLLAEVKIGNKSEVETKLANITGKHDLYFIFSGKYELASWKFVK